MSGDEKMQMHTAAGGGARVRLAIAGALFLMMFAAVLAWQAIVIPIAAPTLVEAMSGQVSTSR